MTEPPPLFRAYFAAGVPRLPALEALSGLGPRVHAVLRARTDFLNERFLDEADADTFQTALTAFYTACVQPPLHALSLRRRAGLVRHGLGHLLRCADRLPQKLMRCLVPDGPYYVAGLGPSFWSAVAQALDPARHPAWTPGVLAGLRRLGLYTPQPQEQPSATYAALCSVFDSLRAQADGLTALHIEHFLHLAASMRGRDLWSGQCGMDLRTLLRQERARQPLRRRLKERMLALREARSQLESSLAACDGRMIGEALRVADPDARRVSIHWHRQGELLTLWVGRLWEVDDVEDMLAAFWQADPIRGAGLWLPAAVLHLKDPRCYFPWSEGIRQGYAALDDAADGGEPAGRYHLFNEGVAALCEEYHIHPLEVPSLLAALARLEGEKLNAEGKKESCFGGFCADTFAFLRELAQNNRRAWMERQRPRYRFAVREPLVELCRALVSRYVEPVLRRERGWDMEIAARSGRALTSIHKNDYGRSDQPYHTALWITFFRRALGRRGDAQFFVRLDADGLHYGLRLGTDAVEAGRLFRQQVTAHAELLYRALADSGALAAYRFGDEVDGDAACVRTAAALRVWAAGKSPFVVKTVTADAPLLCRDELAGDILLTFDRLLPAYACAVEADPLPTLARRAGVVETGAAYTDADFCRATYLSPDWLDRARNLLDLKRQLILQGVPGTGKTHVARCLARLLTRGRDDAMRLVQFHPAYSYEEFVEGIKVKSVEADGRHDVTYPVEDGLLCAFAAEAAQRPAEPHVLVIDEINRGNLPRIFGELLYLLEYREQTIGLPYSKRAFRLPANLIVLGTMNAADRSVAPVDQALRRRFSFLDMPPDADVLAAWLRAHPPARPDFADRVVQVFERLNARLRADLGPAYQVGHSYLMVPGLDEAKLGVVWEHHVRPLLEEVFLGHAERMAAYALDRLLGGENKTKKTKKRRKVEVANES